MPRLPRAQIASGTGSRALHPCTTSSAGVENSASRRSSSAPCRRSWLVRPTRREHRCAGCLRPPRGRLKPRARLLGVDRVHLACERSQTVRTPQNRLSRGYWRPRGCFVEPCQPRKGSRERGYMSPESTCPSRNSLFQGGFSAAVSLCNQGAGPGNPAVNGGIWPG